MTRYIAPPSVATFRYTIFAGDSERRTSYTLDADAASVVTEADGTWTPREPDVHTSHAILEVMLPANSGVLELTGDQHRHLEAWGLLEELLLRISRGESPTQALSELTGQ